jgi:hypothetical protein
MPALQTKERRKNGLLVPIALGGAVLAGIAGWLWWRRRAQAGGPGPGPVLVASTAPGQPEIT